MERSVKLLLILLAIMGTLSVLILYSALVVASEEDDKDEALGRYNKDQRS